MAGLKQAGNELHAVLSNIQSAYNVGSVFRSTGALEVANFWLGGCTSNPARHAGISETALGAQLAVPWESNWRTDLIPKRLRGESVQIVALELTEK